jgi:hypothetical protein
MVSLFNPVSFSSGLKIKKPAACCGRLLESLVPYEVTLRPTAPYKAGPPPVLTAGRIGWAMCVYVLHNFSNSRFFRQVKGKVPGHLSMKGKKSIFSVA